MTQFNEANTIEEAILVRLAEKANREDSKVSDPDGRYGNCSGDWSFIH